MDKSCEDIQGFNKTFLYRISNLNETYKTRIKSLIVIRFDSY